jgi:hypothetical protein
MSSLDFRIDVGLDVRRDCRPFRRGVEPGNLEPSARTRSAEMSEMNRSRQWVHSRAHISLTQTATAMTWNASTGRLNPFSCSSCTASATARSPTAAWTR